MAASAIVPNPGRTLRAGVALPRSGRRRGERRSVGRQDAGRRASGGRRGRTLGYQYDLAGNRTRVIWPDGFYAAYVYDALNRMTAANENGATSGVGLLATIAYDDLGRRGSLNRGNGASTSYGYDTADRIVSLAHAFVGTSSNQTWTFGYNNASQRISRTSANALFDWTNHPPATVNKAYDGLNRDAAIAATTGGYDANGNLTFDGTRTFTYDVENRLLTGSAPTAIALSYDPLGRLAQTTAGSAVTKFLYDGDRLSAEYDGSGNLLRRYVHGPGVDEPLVWYEGSGTTDRRQLHQDPQGSIVAWSDGAGNTAAAQIQAYGPYGEPQAWAGSRFRYTGQIAIPEAQLYYYKARVYDPATGRFLQTDPIGQQDDPNLYAYVAEDPTNRQDSTGRFGVGISGEVWVATGGNFGYASATLGASVSRDGVIQFGVVTATSTKGIGLGGGATVGPTGFLGKVSDLAKTNVALTGGAGTTSGTMSARAPTDAHGSPVIESPMSVISGGLSHPVLGRASGVGGAVGAALVDTSHSSAHTVSANPMADVVGVIYNFIKPALPKIPG